MRSGPQSDASFAGRPPRRAGGALAAEQARAVRRGALRTSGARAAGMAHRRAWQQPLQTHAAGRALAGEPSTLGVGVLLAAGRAHGLRELGRRLFASADFLFKVDHLFNERTVRLRASNAHLRISALHLLTRTGLSLELTQGGTTIITTTTTDVATGGSARAPCCTTNESPSCRGGPGGSARAPCYTTNERRTTRCSRRSTRRGRRRQVRRSGLDTSGDRREQGRGGSAPRRGGRTTPMRLK